ncbi:Rne/Rng family ribonuclease [Demequina oxidasica]|uniref:Rne/Rng family ribonuclease n=1 Tax=Demequina oxidasica TaxID=676199 RepID=UPI00078427E6|nr:Rne/Rng family ribonuclease [Demequina oxidasica]
MTDNDVETMCGSSRSEVPALSEDNNTPAAPANALVFQAPEPAKPRRASAPAGPPASSADKPAASKPKTGADAADKAPKSPSSNDGDGAPKKRASGGRSGAKKSGGNKKSDDAPKGDGGSAEGSNDKSGADASASEKSGGRSKQSSVDGARGDNSNDDNSRGDNSDSRDGGSDGDDGSPRRRRRGGRGRGKKRTDGDNGGDGSNDGSGDNGGNDNGGNNERNSESASDDGGNGGNRGGRGNDGDNDNGGDDSGEGGSRKRRRSRSGRGSRSGGGSGGGSGSGASDDQLQGSTRLQAKRQRRRDSRDGQRRRPVISEAEFLARRESVKRSMVVREKDSRVQIAVMEDDVLVEHYVSHQAQQAMAGNVYLGRVQNVLPGMEAAFIDVGRGRNAVLYAGEVNWDAAGMEGKPRRIELALKPGDTVMVQVTKDPIGHKGARVTSQISLAGRFLVYVPGGGVTGISRKLPDTERARLKKLLREVIPADAGVIVRTAAEGAAEEELRADVERLKRQWESIEKEAKTGKAPQLLRGEPDMAIRVVRDIFNEDFDSLTIQGDDTWNSLSAYVGSVAPDLMERLHKFVGDKDVFSESRIDEQLSKGMDRKVWLPSGGSLVIDRTEAMTVVDVNTGKFVGKGGTLEETMTLNNLEAAEEIVRQLRLRDIGGIIVVDFVDMLLEANRDRVLRRLIECLGRDRTKHQVAEVTSLGLVQMTRKRVGQGLVEAFSETCECCKGRGFLVQGEPVPEASEKQPERSGRRGRGGNNSGSNGGNNSGSGSTGGKRGDGNQSSHDDEPHGETHALDDREDARAAVKATLASIAAAAEKAHHHEDEPAATGEKLAEDVTVDLVLPESKDAKTEAEPAPQASVDTASADAAAPETNDSAAPAVESSPEADESATKE